jgi:predicted molibdopterin-dependent oxidoreductase YjgC
MFRRLGDSQLGVTIRVDGAEVRAAAGDSVAGALLAAGKMSFRASPAAGAARGPYCGMGACFECLVTIDGEGSRQACMTEVRDGMVVTTGVTRRNLLSEVAHDG